MVGTTETVLADEAQAWINVSDNLGFVHPHGAGSLRTGPIAESYCLAIATWKRSSGETRWSWSSPPKSIWTQVTSPLKALSSGP